MAKLKSTISKNAKGASRKRNERPKYQGKEVDPVSVIGKYAGLNNFMGAMFVESKDIVRDPAGNILPWNIVTALAKAEAAGNA